MSKDNKANMDKHTTAEIAKFDALADTFWDKEGHFKTLHQINPIRLAFIQEHIDLADTHVADVGCGGGILSEALAENGANVTAIDLSEVGIRAAKAQQELSASNVDYRLQSSTALAEQLQADNQSLDAVFCMEMLEHVESPDRIVSDCAAMLKSGGIAVFSTINRTRKAHLLAVIFAEYVLNMVPKGTHDPKLFIKPSEMCRMAENVGLFPLDIAGFEYRPFSGDFMASKNTDINYMMAFKKK